MTAAAIRNAVLVVLTVVLVLAGSPVGPGLSSAAFTAKTTNGSSTVGAAADWTPPTVSVQAPAAAIRDTATITALASDAESGIRNVVISVQAVGAATWTTLCTDSSSPFSCAWDTRAVADGAYDLRAVATDNSGYVTTSATVRATVGNAVGVVLAEPGEIVKGSVTLTATVQNAGTTAYPVTFEYAVAGSGNFKTLCAASTTYSCTWLTALFANDFYDLRAAVTANGVTTYSNVAVDVLVDNALPTVSMTDPGSPLSGTVTLAAAATDAHSGIARVVIQISPTGLTWQDACTVTAPPYTCRYSTTSLLNGITYAFRAVATDGAGNVSTSLGVGLRTIDNTVASVAMEDPGAFLTGTVTLTATANSTAGVASVAIQIAPNGTSTWTTVCTPTVAPYSCAWNSRSVADGLYAFRAVLTDSAGKTTTSVTVSGRNVDNRAVRGVDVQTTNGGTTAGRLDAGDTMSFTYSTQMSPASIMTGWSGSAIAVNLRLRDGNSSGLGTGNAGDTVDIVLPNTTTAVNLGSVNLKGDYVKNNKTSTFNATMTATTASVNGQPVTVVRITVGTLIGGGALRTATTTAAAAMVWTPSNLAKDLAGTASSNAPVTETGSLDREF